MSAVLNISSGFLFITELGFTILCDHYIPPSSFKKNKPPTKEILQICAALQRS